VADDKVVYSRVPEITRHYPDQEPIVPNAPNSRCMDKQSLAYVTKNIKDPVIKPANASGVYGMLTGPASTNAERDEFVKSIKTSPRNCIAQPTPGNSTVPNIARVLLEPRHVDPRPFILSDDTMEVTTVGLARVALHKGSLVVNSSQGGGSKDTWIVDRGAEVPVSDSLLPAFFALLSGDSVLQPVAVAKEPRAHENHATDRAENRRHAIGQPNPARLQRRDAGHVG
jgi:uncharacterized circularly permuted ATP-grasp superfamily protein